MTWAEILATFNFVVWIMPIFIRSWIAWRKPGDNTDIRSTKVFRDVSGVISKLNLRGKKLVVSNGTKTDRDIQEGSK